MADVNANIGVNIDTSAALAQLKALQRQISQFHSSIARSSESAAIAQKSLQKNLISSINSIGAFSAELRNVRTSAESFTNSLEKNKFSMREYFRYAGASTKTFGRLFKSEFDTIGKVAEERVKTLQTQYIKMGRNASGAMEAIAIRPTSLNMQDYGTRTAIAAQKQALFNQLMKQGTTNLLNFGKNTQWAGRQLMVGFTIPLTIVGSTATRTFMEMEAQALKFKKVYGDLFTPKEETKLALDNITELGRQFTKYGIAVSQTVGLAAEAAAAGFQGLDLQRQTTEATRLSVLGQIDSQKALETTISLQNAFGMSSDKLADSINFLNAVENQTVVSLDDITTAIPKVAPVIQQLGGDVKDLTFFIAAMKEGGINASEGANALKSGLAALINPTTKASAMLEKFGINAKEIVEKNKGNLKATVIEFATALNQLDPLNRAQAIEQMFGKFQFARLSTLFANVARDGNQAARVLDLANSSVQELSALSEQELGMTAESSMNKFKKSVEDLKLALIPVGQAFLEAATPIVEFVGGVLEKFGNLSDGAKRLITVLTVGIGAVGPIFLMTFGLLANLLANGLKGILILRQGYLRLGGQSQILGEQTQYLNSEQLEAAAVAHSLDQTHAKLTQTFNLETDALIKLISAYQSASRAGQSFAFNNPGMMMPGRAARKFASGIVSVPGPKGAGDVVPAMLSPGEAVIPAAMAKKYAPLIEGMIANNIPGYQVGRRPKIPIYAENAIRLQNAGQNMRQQSGAGTGLFNVLANLTARVGESRGIPVTQRRIASGQFDDITEQYKAITQKFVDKLNTNYDYIIKNVSDTNKAYAIAWKQAGKAVKSEVNSIQNDVERGAVRRVFGLEKDIYSTIPTAPRSEGGNMPERARQGAFKTSKFGISSYTKLRPGIKALFQRQSGQSAADLQMGHVFGPKQVDINQLMKDPQASSSVRSAARVMGIQIANNAAEGIKQGANEVLAAASPSRKMKKVGQDAGQGLILGVQEYVDDAKMVGQKLGAGMVQTASGLILPGGIGGGAKPKTAAAPLGDITARARLNRESLINLQQQKQSQLLTASSEKLAKLNSKIMGGTFALTSLAGVASMTSGSLGKLSEIIFKISGPLFALSSILQLLGGSKIFQFIQNFGKLKFGLISVGITGLLTGFSMYRKSQEETRRKLLSFKDALTITEKQSKATGDYFGVISRKSSLETGSRGTEAASKTPTFMDEVNKFINSDNFKNNYESAVKSLSEQTDNAARTALFLRAQGLLAEGYSEEQINIIISALQQKAGKQNLNLLFKDIKIDALNKDIMDGLKEQLASLGKFAESQRFRKVIKEVFNPDTQKFDQITSVVPLKNFQTAVDNVAAGINSLLKNVTSLRDQGRISVEDLQKSYNSLMYTINTSTPDSRVKIALLNSALKDLKDPVAIAARETENLTKKTKLLEAAMFGALIPTALLNEYLRENSGNPNLYAAGQTEARINALIEAAKKSSKALYDAVQKAAYTPTGTEDKKPKTQLDVLKQAQDFIALQEQLIDMQNASKLKAYNNEIERQEKLLKDINKTIDETTQEFITPIEKKIKANSYLIDEIAIKEEKINEQYNLQIDALNKVKSINEDIAASEKERLTLADALTRGDISAAATIAQDARARQAAFINERMEASLTTSRDSRIALLGRNALEKENKQLQLDIAKIQKEKIDGLNLEKDAIQKNINTQNELKSSLEKTIEKTKENITYLGLTKEQIDMSVRALDLAQNENIDLNSSSFLGNILKGALGDANALLAALKEVAKASKDAFSTPLARGVVASSLGIPEQVSPKLLESIVSGAKPSDVGEKTRLDLLKTMPKGMDPTGSGAAASGRYTAQAVAYYQNQINQALAKATGGMVPKYYVSGGYSKGTDTIPAMLTPGEFVVRKNAVDSFGVNNLNKINDGSYSGSSVYNYSLSVNVKSDSSPDDIARTVMTQIKRIDSQRIKTQRGA